MTKLIDLLTCLLLIVLLIVFFALVFGAIDYLHRLIDAYSCNSCNSWLFFRRPAMLIGMLWYDNSPTDALAIKVQRAAAYYARKYGRTPTACYARKYGRTPTACYAHPTSLTAETVIAGITVKPNRSVMPNHYWIGVEEAQ